MNRPPLPVSLSAKRTRRPGQNLTSLAPCLRGAILPPVIPKIPQSQLWILVKRTDVFGEGGKNFILHRFLLEVLHPPHRPNRGKQIQLVNCDARKAREIKHQNGRERPHFSGFNPPKKSSRSLPPVLGIRQQVHFAGRAQASHLLTVLNLHHHDDLYDFRIKACMAGPQGGETLQCLS